MKSRKIYRFAIFNCSIAEDKHTNKAVVKALATLYKKRPIKESTSFCINDLLQQWGIEKHFERDVIVTGYYDLKERIRIFLTASIKDLDIIESSLPSIFPSCKIEKLNEIRTITDPTYFREKIVKEFRSEENEG